MKLWIAVCRPGRALGRRAGEACDRRALGEPPRHFWLVLAAALASVALGYAVLAAAAAARRASSSRSLAFLASAAFLGLHALATPGVLLGKNAGFELATPVGLVVAAAFAAASVIEFSARGAERVLRAAPVLLGALATLSRPGRSCL